MGAFSNVKIAVVGSCVTDQITYAPRIPQPGETVEGCDYVEGFGGKGANQAVAAALCGAKVYMVGRVGADTRGRDTINNLIQKGIDTSHVIPVADVVTGVAPIWVDTRTGQNSIIVVLGANDHLTPDAVNEASETLRSVNYIVMQREMPVSSIYRTLEIAQGDGTSKHHITTLLNVAPPPQPSEPLDFQKLSGLDYLIVNETEAAALLDRAKINLSEVDACANELLNKAEIGNVILTLGGDGLVWYRPGHDAVFVPAFKMEKDGRKIVDTTGAGDAFIGSFAAFVSYGVFTESSLRLASLYAGLSVTKRGTQISYPYLEEFRQECKSRGLEF